MINTYDTVITLASDLGAPCGSEQVVAGALLEKARTIFNVNIFYREWKDCKSTKEKRGGSLSRVWSLAREITVSQRAHYLP